MLCLMWRCKIFRPTFSHNTFEKVTSSVLLGDGAGLVVICCVHFFSLAVKEERNVQCSLTDTTPDISLKTTYNQVFQLLISAPIKSDFYE